jgi:antitoxin VapB
MRNNYDFVIVLITLKRSAAKHPIRRGSARNTTIAPFAQILQLPLVKYAKAKTMSERRVKLFKNGQNQAVRIPHQFELPGEDAIIRKEGQRLIIEAAPPRSLLAVLATLPTLDENFPPIEDLPAEPVEL